MPFFANLILDAQKDIGVTFEIRQIMLTRVVDNTNHSKKFLMISQMDETAFKSKS